MIGNISLFTVLRKTDIGYIIVNNGKEYFLHNNECLGKKLLPGDKIEAFLYFDNKKRIAATLMTPIIKSGESGLLRVKDINNDLGVFLDNGINKDLLLSFKEFGVSKKLYPNINDYLYVSLIAKKSQLKAEIKKESFKKITNLNIGDKFLGYVSLYVKDTMYLVNNKGESLRINKGCYCEKIRYGKMVEAKITYLGYNETLGEISFKKEDFYNTKKEEVLKIIKNYKKDVLTFKLLKERYQNKLDISGKQYKTIILLLKSENKIDIKNGFINLKDDKK